MSVSEKFAELIKALITTVRPITGEYFREVELKYGHPDDVISGEGTFLRGNRFIRPGKHAVYASLTEETALAEYKYGQSKAYSRLALEKSVHMTYPILIAVDRSADFRDINKSLFEPLFKEIFEANDHAASQEVGERLLADGIQALVYPSAIPGHTGANIVCVLDTVPRPHVQVKNRDEILTELERIGLRIHRPKS